MEEPTLSEEEVKQYDRQLRLWGLTAQTRLRNAKVLVVNMGGLAAEVAKNLVLAGIGSLTMLDSKHVQDSDLGSNFFLTTEDLGKNRAVCSQAGVSALNPRVQVGVDSDDVASKPASFFNTFDVVVLTECSMAVQVQLNRLCRAAPDKRILFFAAETCGWYAYYHEDLQTHDYVTNKESTGDNGEDTSTKEKHQEIFPTIAELCSLSWDDIGKKCGRRLRRSGGVYLAFRAVQDYEKVLGRVAEEKDERACCEYMAKELDKAKLSPKYVDPALLGAVLRLRGVQLNPVCAILGGLLGSEILKAISGQDKPWDNVMIYDAQKSEAVTLMLRP